MDDQLVWTDMNFFADWNAVSSLGGLMDRAAADLQLLADAHLRDDPALDAEGVLGEHVFPQLDRWREIADRQPRYGHDLGVESATALRATAGYYLRADTTAAADLDATYPTYNYSPPPAGLAPETATEFTDLLEPVTQEWGRPVGQEEIAGDQWPTMAAAEAERVLGTASAANHLRALAIRTLEHDPFDKAARLVAGDWQKLARMAGNWR